MSIFLRFLPAESRALVELGRRIVGSLDPAEERKAAVAYGTAMLADGKVSFNEWIIFGETLGFLSKKPVKPKKKAKPENKKV